MTINCAIDSMPLWSVAVVILAVSFSSSCNDVFAFVPPSGVNHHPRLSLSSTANSQRSWKDDAADQSKLMKRYWGWPNTNTRLYQSMVVEASNDTQTHAHDRGNLREPHSKNQEYDESKHDGDESDDEEDDEYTEPDDRHDDDVEILVDHFFGSNFCGGGSNGDNDDDFNNRGDHVDDNDSNGRRAHAVAPSGIGKTLLSMQTLTTLYTQSPKDMRTAILVGPTLEVVDQTLNKCDEFGVFRDVPHERIIVSSSTSRKEPHTTDPEVIAKFLSSLSLDSYLTNPTETLKFLVCTYNSLPKVAEAMDIVAKRENDTDTPIIDFAIFDEAHRMEGCSNMYGYGLDDDNIAIRNRLFLSATPNNYTEKVEQVEVLASKMTKDGSRNAFGKRTGNFVKARSFSQKELFGPCLVHYTEQECVDKNITVPKAICVLDPAEVEALVGRKLDPLYSREEFLPFAIKAVFAKFNVTKGLSFHSKNIRAESFVELAADVFGDDISLHRVDGNMSMQLREQILKEALSKPKSLIANCDLYREGKDVPEWDLVVMADAVRSRTKAKQIIGRISRSHPGKEKGYILLPIFVESEEDLDANGGAGYDMFVSAFQAMLANDPALQSAVNFIIGEELRLGYPLPVEEYPKVLREAFKMPESMPVKVVNKVMRRLVVEYDVGYLDRKWKKMYGLLKSYWEEHGHCLVPNRKIWRGKPLGKWVGWQRSAYKNGSMLSSRKALLDELDFVWDVKEERWHFMYSLMVQYKEREGDCLVTQGYKEDGEALGTWVNNQRAEYRNGNISSHRRKLLEELGFAWNADDAKWERMFKLLLQYKEREGDCHVPFGYKDDEVNLANWLSVQRKEMKKGTLDPSRQQRLEDAGVEWDGLKVQAAREAALWNSNFAVLEKFLAREGHCNVKQKYVCEESGVKLGVWLHTQKDNWKKGKLYPERYERLKTLGVDW